MPDHGDLCNLHGPINSVRKQMEQQFSQNICFTKIGTLQMGLHEKNFKQNLNGKCC